MALIVTHCYPSKDSLISGIWLKRLFGDQKWARVLVIPKSPLKALRYITELRKSQHIIACWAWPAGVLAWLSRRQYILYAIGLDVFMARDNWFWRQILRIVARRADRVVFCGEHTQRLYYEMYGDLNTELITLPMGIEP